MIAIIDYGVGNLFSLSSSLRTVGAEVVVTDDREILKKADRLILPGVGAFATLQPSCGQAVWTASCGSRLRAANRCSAFVWACSFYLKKAMNSGNIKVWG